LILQTYYYTFGQNAGTYFLLKPIGMKSRPTLVIIFFALLITACDSGKLKETPIEDFIGTWEVHGRNMFEGIKIDISKNEKGNLTGNVKNLNDNKYVKFFIEPGDVWVSSITRSSNYEFRLTEKKIGSALFGLYGLDTSTEYKVQFIDKNTIGLASGNSDPTESQIKYVRAK